MPFAWNLPYLSVFLAMVTAILLSVLPGAKRAYWLTVGVSAAVTIMSLVFLVFVAVMFLSVFALVKRESRNDEAIY